MGRKPLALKRQGRPAIPMPEAVKDPSGGVEKQPESSNPLSKNTNLQPKKGNIQLETIESHPEPQTDSVNLSSLSKAKKRCTLSMVRRSQRIQNASPSQDKEIERIIEAITLNEGEKDEVPLDHEDDEQPEPIHTQNLVEKIDCLLQQIEEQRKTIDELKVTRGYSSTESPREPDVRYKNLYFESQKKIEALTNENHLVSLKLERALGKLEAYESEGMKSMKEVILVTNMTRSTQAFPSMDAGAGAKTSPKRKNSRTSSMDAGAGEKTSPKIKKSRASK